MNKITSIQEWLEKNPGKGINDYNLIFGIEQPDVANAYHEMIEEEIGEQKIVFKERLENGYHELIEEEIGKQKNVFKETTETPLIPPFSNDFLCPKCGFLDNGAFCSSCGNEIQISRFETKKFLCKRLIKLGFEDFSIWKEKENLIAEKYQLNDFILLGGTLLCKGHPSNNGLSLELLFVIQDDTVSDTEIKEKIETYSGKIEKLIKEANKLPRKKRSSKPEEYLGQLSLRIARIRDSSIQKNGEGSYKGKTKIWAKTGGGELFLRSYNNGTIPIIYKFKFQWEFLEININNTSVHSESNLMFDLLKHQAKIVAKQTHASKESFIEEKKTNVFYNAIYSIIESFVEYFKILFQYVKNPHYVTELVIKKKYISLGKILNLYLVGLVCSVTIPSILSNGYLNTNNLTSFGDLPPFISEIAELLTEILISFLLAIFIHITLKITKHKGSLFSLLIGLLFMKAFIQLFERPYDYLTHIPLLNAIGGDIKAYTNILDRFAPVYFLAYIYFLFPLMYVVYRASRRMTSIAFLIAGILMLVIASIASGDFIFSPSQLTKERFDNLSSQEQQVMEIYKSKVVPNIKLGSKTGNYSKAIAGIEKCKKSLNPIITGCETINRQVKQSFTETDKLVLYSDKQCQYFQAKYDFFILYAQYLQKNITVEELEEHIGVVKSRMRELEIIRENL